MPDWPNHIIDIMSNDVCVALAYRTPAGGVVMTPVTTVGMHDPAAGTVTVTSSLGNWKKLVRMRDDDRVAIVYHARDHSGIEHPQLLVAQGRASFPDKADGNWLTPEAAARQHHFLPAHPKGRFLGWVTREYYDHRVPITIAVERIIVDGADQPAAGPVSTPPAKGTSARVKPKKYLKRWKNAKHFLLGYVDVDGFPTAHRITPRIDSGDIRFRDVRLPEGGRRAGLLAHWFEPKLVGQGSVLMTGWLEVHDGEGKFSPHTAGGYAMPPKELAYHLAGGLASKFGYRSALKKGLVRNGEWQRPA